MGTNKLQNMSREEKLRLLAAVEEKERRNRQKKEEYKPNPGQIQVHKSAKEIRIVTAGNGFGKSTLSVNEILAAVHGYNPWQDKYTPVPTKNIVVLDSPDKVENLWLPALRQWTDIPSEWCDKKGRHHIMAINFPNGSTISFYFHQQDQLAFESIEVDGLVVFDEPMPRFCWVGLKRGGRVKGRTTRYLLVGTAIARAWIRKELIEPIIKGDIDGEVFKFKSEINRANLAEGWLESFASVLSEKEKAVRLDGEYFDLSGLALAHLLDRAVHVVEPFSVPKEWPCVVAVDPHPSKAHHAVMITCSPEGRLFVIKERSEKSTAREFARGLKDMMDGYTVVDVVCDCLGKQDLTGGEGFNSFIQVLQNEGVPIRSTTYDDKSDEAFIDRIQSALVIPTEEDNYGKKLPILRFFSNCVGSYNDAENVQWLKVQHSEENKPRLDIQNKDYLSCIKYALATNIYFTKGRTTSITYRDPAKAYGLNKAKTFQKPGQLGRMFRGKRPTITLEQWLRDEDDDD